MMLYLRLTLSTQIYINNRERNLKTLPSSYYLDHFKDTQEFFFHISMYWSLLFQLQRAVQLTNKPDNFSVVRLYAEIEWDWGDINKGPMKHSRRLQLSKTNLRDGLSVVCNKMDKFMNCLDFNLNERHGILNIQFI